MRLEGARVVLRPAEVDDVAALARIRSTPEVRRWWDDAAEPDIAPAVEASIADTDTQVYVVLEPSDPKRVIGLIQSHEEDDPQYRSAGIDIYLDPAVHGRGLGTDAVRALCRHLIEERDHHRLTIDPGVANEAAIRAYERVGFAPVGVMRQYERGADGTWHDGLLMELLADEWWSLVPLLSKINELLAERRQIEVLSSAVLGPLVVGLDGGSGAGKSTLAGAVCARLAGRGRPISCALIEGDEFYAGGTGEEWDSRSAVDKAEMCIDWRRQFDVLAALRRGEEAEFHGFDWQAFDGRLSNTPTVVEPADVVLLEGAYSCRPELAEVLDLRVLLSTPVAERHRRLGTREGDAYRDEWFARWTEAEQHYFGAVMPPSTFDLVLPG